MIAAMPLLGGCFEEEKAAKAKMQAMMAAPMEVPVQAVTVKDVPVYAEWVGTLDGFIDAKITSRVQGYLFTQNYREGSFVKKGDLLFTVDPRPFQAAAAQAKAQLAQAQAQQKQSQITADRYRPLVKDGVVSQQEYDNANQTNLANIAAVEAAKANLVNAELNLSYTKIISPIDGIAGIRQANIGDLVSGTTTLTTISQVDPIYAVFPISEQEYLKAAKVLNAFDPNVAGNTAATRKLDLYLADESHYSQEGTFSFADRQVNVNTGTITLKAQFPNKGNVLRPGQFAKVRANVMERKNAILIPQRAVIETQGSYFVATVNKENKVDLVKVTTGERVGSMWLIESGLKAGDMVVVEGVQKVKTGMVVKPAPVEATAAAKP
ncbi:MAG: efflux RND transporter periplasmic adaptor subunit [Alphaproteobacteria bacterium]|jgi:membrane fusion protein (multidrug efflux system)|nr:efflux RND transporter periplasmic adaptor subunit [Alphaproteobacteria bacterium]